MEQEERELRWASEAVEDLLEICSYCEERFGPIVAAEVWQEYDQLAVTLSAYPRIGRAMPDELPSGEPIFTHPHSWCIVYYTFSSTSLTILRVFDTRIHPSKHRI